jgi:hypothetical protein
VVVIFALGCGGVLVDALRLPGTDSPAAKLAEWGRDHGLGGLVTGLESVSYRPAAGGRRSGRGVAPSARPPTSPARGSG